MARASEQYTGHAFDSMEGLDFSLSHVHDDILNIPSFNTARNFFMFHSKRLLRILFTDKGITKFMSKLSTCQDNIETLHAPPIG